MPRRSRRPSGRLQQREPPTVDQEHSRPSRGPESGEALLAGVRPQPGRSYESPPLVAVSLYLPDRDSVYLVSSQRADPIRVLRDQAGARCVPPPRHQIVRVVALPLAPVEGERLQTRKMPSTA